MNAVVHRALIICPDYDPLPGFEPSVACMSQLLAARGFELDVCHGPQATRDGILSAYRGLVRATRSQDAVVVYYVGHSGRTVNASYEPNRGVPRTLRNICPSDYARTTADDFRGICSFELSHLLAQLTAKTTNVTAILESCFTTAMMRGPEPPKARPIKPKLSFVGLRRHLTDLRNEYGQLPFPAGNPHAIRVSAAGSQSKAYQIQLPPTDVRAAGFELEPGSWIGSMTWTLARTLAQLGEAGVSWESIGEILRSDLVIQRPEVEGPTDRIPFSLAEVSPARLSIRSEQGTAILAAGQLLGLSAGDVYGVTSPGTGDLLEEVTIDQVSIREARARRPAWRPGSRELPVDAIAVPISTARQRSAVRVLADGPHQREIEAVLMRSTSVRPAAAGDGDQLAALRLHGDSIELQDEHGAIVSVHPYPAQLASAVADLENLATERRLHALTEHACADLAEVTIELVLFDGDRRRALPAHGATLGLGDEITVQVVNRTARLIWANVFNIGLRRQITQLQSSPSGKALPPGAVWDLGEQPDGSIGRFDLRWPAHVPRDRPRLDTLMVVLTHRPMNLGALVTRITTPRTTAMHARFRKPAVTRGPSPADEEEAFAIRWLDYWLAPAEASLDFGEPHLEGAPHDPFARTAPGARSALRIDLRTLASNRRVDVLVCEPAGMRAATFFEPSRGELELWSGELAVPAEVFVWISALGARAPLAELLETPELRARTGSLARSTARAEVPSFQLAAIARAALRTLDPDVETAFRSSFEPGSELQRYDTAAVSFSLQLVAHR